MGYLPLQTIRLRGKDPSRLAAELEAGALQTGFYSQEQCRVYGGALYAWDRDSLGILLESGRLVLSAVGWTRDADEFVERVATQAISSAESPDLYALIGKAFSDPRFLVATEES
jgi:hypothetical protein